MTDRYLEFAAADQFKFLCDADMVQHLRRSLTLLFARLPDIGVLPQYSSFCVLMATFVSLVLSHQRFRVRLIGCRVLIHIDDDHYFLGSGAPLKPGQFDGHAACVVNDRFLVDFGLGAAAKYLDLPAVPQAVAARARADASQGDVLTRVAVPDGATLEWLVSPQAVNLNELTGDMAVARDLFRRWRNATAGRLPRA